MVNLSEDIRPLTEFKRNTANFVKLMAKTKRPVVLTVNGKAKLVVQDANSYQHILDRLDRLEAVEAIRRGVKDVEEGRVRDAREALEALRIKLGISS
jgi:prevent-host-death family protein